MMYLKLKMSNAGVTRGRYFGDMYDMPIITMLTMFEVVYATFM